jgi:hypothetical protein
LADKKSTWREERYTLKPDDVATVNFYDTKPNHIYVANNSGLQLFMSLSSVSASTFDTIIPPYGTRLYAREMGVGQVNFFSENDTDFEIQVTSWEGEFNPASMSQTQEIVSPASGLLGTLDIKNILSPLPTGDNTIGRVKVDTLPILPAGNNKIGMVDIDTMPEIEVKNDSGNPLTVQFLSGTILDGLKNVALAGTPEVLGANQVIKKITIKANSTNTDKVKIGDATPVYPLSAGEIITLTVNNLNIIFVDAIVSGEGITWIAEV